MRQNTGENPEHSGSQQWRGQPRNPPYQSQPQQAHPPQQGQRGQQQGQSHPPQQSPQQGQSHPPQQQGQQPQQQGQQPQQQGQQPQQQGPGQSPQGQGFQQSGPQQQPFSQQQHQQAPLQPPMSQQGPPQMAHQGPPQSMQHMQGQSGMGQQLGMSGQQMQGSQQMQEPGVTGLQPTTVDEIVQTDVVTAEPDTPIPDVVSMMEAEDVGAVVLVEGNEPVGVVTDRKIALSLQEMETPAERTAGDVSSEDIITGNTSMNISDVLESMSENSIRRLPIVDDDQELEGIVTLDDVLVMLGSELKNATEIIRSQSPRL